MRPVLLKISGLQSYREVQEIDFTSLCDAGVFGIFGPTGSGKSTILDAITLALYGKVERASGGTQGIMNHAETSLSVSFTFELAGADGYRRYRVERQFKKSGDVTINNTVCRIVHLGDDGDRVMADKVADVSQAVQELLGLSMSDFTRAVVLPQGKFAEFLTLAGKDRRQMLQRLFHLEQYGDLLNGRIGQLFKETDLAMKEIAAEQLGLGDASEQVLADSERRLREAGAAADKMRSIMLEQEKLYLEAAQVREWEQQKGEAEMKAGLLRQQEEHIVRQERLLEKSRYAELLRPYFEQREEAANTLREASESNRSSQLRHSAAAERLKHAAQCFELAQSALSADEAKLLVRLNELEEAKELQDEIGRIRVVTDELRNNKAIVDKEMTAVSEQLVKTQAVRDKAVQRQNELKQELASTELPPDIRRLLREAGLAKRDIVLHLTQLAEHTDQLSVKMEQMNKLERGKREIGLEHENVVKRFADCCEQVAGTIEQWRQLERLTESIVSNLPGRIEQARRSERTHELQQLSSRLAEQLTEGLPCPVCGSLQHPEPAHHMVNDHSVQKTDEIGMLDKLLDTLRAASLEIRQSRVSLEHLYEQASELLSEQEVGFPELVGSAGADRNPVSGTTGETSALKAISIILEQSDQAFGQAAAGLSELDGSTADLELHATRIREIIRNLEQKTPLHQQSVGTVGKHLNALSKQAQQLDIEFKAAVTLIEELKVKAASVRLSANELKAQWELKYAHAAGYDTLDVQLEQLVEAEQKAHDIRERLDKSVIFIEQTARQQEELQRRLMELEKRAIHTEAELKNHEQLFGDKANMLKQRVGDSSVQKLLEQTSAVLLKLRDDSVLAKQQLEQAQREESSAGNKLSADAQSEQTAIIANAKADEGWKLELARTPLSGAEEMKQSLLGIETKEQWQAEIKLHREKEQESRLWLAQLDGLLQGRSVSEQQLHVYLTSWTEAKKGDEAAFAERVKAERDLENVQAKHARWKELAGRYAELQLRHTLLGKLQSVFRGNAFVEYIAEEQLLQVCRAASERLGFLTRQRYAIEVDSGGGFIIRDDANGGVRRPVSTLSGGETFLTSLALALALSAQIQLSGQYPLEFFFLDEGFGTLDPELLETVISALERLHLEHLTVGIISHVPELRARLPRRIVVHPAEAGGAGSRIAIETL